MREKKSFLLIISVIAVGVLFAMNSCNAVPVQVKPYLAIAAGNNLKIVDTSDLKNTLFNISTYYELMRVVYSPDGKRLAVMVCSGDRIVELDTEKYVEQQVLMRADSCPWDMAFSPDSQSLAATIPLRKPSPADSLLGYLKVVGNTTAESILGTKLPAVAYRPGGNEIALSNQAYLYIFAVNQLNMPFKAIEIKAISLAYTIDGSRLIVGTPDGCTVLDAANDYSTLYYRTDIKNVSRIAVDPTGKWIALMNRDSVNVYRSPDLESVKRINTGTGNDIVDTAFSPDGSKLAVAERFNNINFYQVFSWKALTPLVIPDRVNAIAYQPMKDKRIPVLFVHGHSGGSGRAWFETPNGNTSFAAILAENPNIPIDTFFLELPLHGNNFPENNSRSIEDDSIDILAAIEGGKDSKGANQVGILNMPAYQSTGKVAIIAYSQGTISSRFYIKNLMGTRKKIPPVTVSEFVALAAPNHGVGGSLSCGNTSEPDRSVRQLCCGLTADFSTQLASCGKCPNGNPTLFSSNTADENTFLTDLNGHSLSDSCDSKQDHPEEAPYSRSPQSNPDGVLYVNLYGANNSDLIVGGGTQSLDCAGRRLAKNLSLDAVNIEISGINVDVHSNFPHHKETICITLRTILDHINPSTSNSCNGILPQNQ